jgi:hypothetical protein
VGELKFTIEGRGVFAYANGQTKPALTVELLADRPTGKLGLRVGNGSDGWFRNLKITPAGNDRTSSNANPQVGSHCS